MPGARAPVVNPPVALLVKLREVPVSLLEMVTFAPTTALPCGSVTVPEIAPVETETWADARQDGTNRVRRAKRAAKREKCRNRYIMNTPPLWESPAEHRKRLDPSELR